VFKLLFLQSQTLNHVYRNSFFLSHFHKHTYHYESHLFRNSIDIISVLGVGVPDRQLCDAISVTGRVPRGSRAVSRREKLVGSC